MRKRYRITMSFNAIADSDEEANELANHIKEQMELDEDNNPYIEDICINTFGSIDKKKSVLRREND